MSRRYAKFKNSNQYEYKETSDVAFQELRFRILRFLGSIGGDNKLLLQNSDNLEVMSWDFNKYLKFTIPFKEVNIDICLGNCSNFIILLLLIIILKKMACSLE